MKRKAALLFCALLLALLCGCSRLVPDEYMQVTPHSPETKTQEQADVLTVNNYKTLKNALRSLVQNGVEHGVLHTNQYAGDIETDLPQAAYEIARVDPIGAYAIDYITHDCTLIVTYYEIRVDITFRDVLTPLDEIEYAGSESARSPLTLLRSASSGQAVKPRETSPETVSQSTVRQPAGYCDSRISPLTVPSVSSFVWIPGPRILPLVVLTLSVSAAPPISSTSAETVSTEIFSSVFGKKTVSVFSGKSTLPKTFDLHGWMMSLLPLTV